MVIIRNLFFMLCLLASGTACLTAGAPRGGDDNSPVVRESGSAELLSKKKTDGVKITFRCRITNIGGCHMMLARILRNDSAKYIAGPGIRFRLADGNSVVLKAERPRACCSSWADGQWYNAAFRLADADVERLSAAEIISITLPFYGNETTRAVAPGKGWAVARMLQSVGED